MYIALLSYVRPLDEVEPLLSAHRDYLERHLAGGVFVAAGPRESGLGSVILVREHPRSLVRDVLALDPLVLAGVASHELVEFTPAQMLAGFDNYL